MKRLDTQWICGADYFGGCNADLVDHLIRLNKQMVALPLASMTNHFSTISTGRMSHWGLSHWTIWDLVYTEPNECV